MGIQYADEPKQPGETLRYSMEYVPGESIATGDTLTGAGTVVITRMSDGVIVTNDVVGPPVIVGMLAEAVQRDDNTLYAKIEKGTHGETYKITFTCGTTAGELAVEEDLILEVKSL